MQSDSVRLGVVGTGHRAAMVKSWLQADKRARLVAAADPNPANLHKFHETIGQDVPLVETTDWHRLLERDDVDAVVIISPDFTHDEIAVAALQAGKAVYCEKPMAITVEGCDRMLAAAHETGKLLFVGHNMRYMPLFQTMKEIVESGVIGEIKAVWVRHFVSWGGYYYYHDWHGVRRNTTSLLLQKGSHDIDMIHWITGRYGEKVSAFGSLTYYGGDRDNQLRCADCPEQRSCPEAKLEPEALCAFRREIDVEDNMSMLIQLEGGIIANYSECHFAPDYHRNYTFIGTEGRLENSEIEGKVWVWTRRSGTYRELTDRTYTLKPSFPGGTGHQDADRLIFTDFLDALLQGKKPVADPLDARMAVAVGCAGAESMRAGGTLVEVQPLPVASMQR